MTPHPTSEHPEALAAARELLQIDGVLTTYRCAGIGNGAEEQLAAIISRHFQPLRHKIEETKEILMVYRNDLRCESSKFKEDGYTEAAAICDKKIQEINELLK